MSDGATHGPILVTGARGQVGEALTRALKPLGEVVAPGRAELDLADGDSIRRMMRKMQPRWVVNAGAYTAVDQAESQPEPAFAINATALEIIAEEAKKIGAAVVHYSTDYVFNGQKQTPYVETDATGPLNVYGLSKLQGERALGESGVPHLIFRTSWVYGATGKNFVRSILRMAREREQLRIVADQYGAPTWSEELARLTAHAMTHVEEMVAKSGVNLGGAMLPVSGIYHATGAGETSWCEFAAAAVEELRRREPEAKLATVEAITTAEYPTAARRPRSSRLDCTKLEQVFGWKMPEWRESLKRVVAELAQNGV